MEEQRHRELKTQLYAELARPAKAFANPRRLELVDMLAQSERSVDELAGLTGMSVANTSQHLQVLKSAGMVSVRRQGTYAYYSLAGDDVERAWQALRSLGERRVAEVERVARAYLNERDSMAGLSLAELTALLRMGEVTLLDVRPPEEFEAGHIVGAVSIPLPVLLSRLHELPPQREIVAYCRGPYCVLADDAVAALRARGYGARRLEGGLPEWRSEGLPVAISTAAES